MSADLPLRHVELSFDIVRDSDDLHRAYVGGGVLTITGGYIPPYPDSDEDLGDAVIRVRITGRSSETEYKLEIIDVDDIDGDIELVHTRVVSAAV